MNQRAWLLAVVAAFMAALTVEGQETKLWMYCLADTTVVDFSATPSVRRNRKVISALFEAPNIRALDAARRFEKSATLAADMTATPFTNAICYTNYGSTFSDVIEYQRGAKRVYNAISTEWAPPRDIR